MSIEINGSGGGDRNVAVVARRFGPPPAFLTKTFQIVNDANTNSIVSWAQNGHTFIIWDHIKFSAQILPNYFRHNNFSSFVYQLNNYGFRKIGVDHQWEYSSPDFQQGKPHLLSNMKRRPLQMSPTPQHEMKKLKKQQSDMELKMVELRQAANNLEASSKKLMVQWAKACEIIIAKREKAEISSQENEVHVEEADAVSLSQKQPLVSSSAAADDQSKSAAMIGDYTVDQLDILNKRLFENDDDDEASNQHAIAQDFQEWFVDLW